jgi:DNA-binding response OmpR family regulator
MRGELTAGGSLPKTRVLVVEDELDIACLIKHTLERGGRTDAEIVATSDGALRSVAETLPDLVILDLNLPVVGGLDVCRILRARPHSAHVPIIILTATSGESDRVAGLDLGADDYITKPFSVRELAARVNAVLRRGARRTSALADSTYRGAHLVADFEAVSVSVDGQAVRLTRREFELLRYLVQHRNRVLSRDRLLEQVWSYERDVETRSVDVHVGRLRTKLGPAGRQIETLVGLGYRFTE